MFSEEKEYNIWQNGAVSWCSGQILVEAILRTFAVPFDKSELVRRNKSRFSLRYLEGMERHLPDN